MAVTGMRLVSFAMSISQTAATVRAMEALRRARVNEDARRCARHFAAPALHCGACSAQPALLPRSDTPGRPVIGLADGETVIDGSPAQKHFVILPGTRAKTHQIRCCTPFLAVLRTDDTGACRGFRWHRSHRIGRDHPGPTT